MIHDLKCWPEYFQAVKSGIKPFELRKDDRGYTVGDILHLREFDPDTALYTGDEIDKTVTYVLPLAMFGAGNDDRYVIMGLAPRDWTPCAEGLPTPDARGFDGKDKVYICSTKSHKAEYIQEFCYGTHIGFDGRDCIGWFFNDSFRGSLGDSLKVIAWMPKPEPYNPDRKEDAE